jgi:hypothetical protein
MLLARRNQVERVRLLFLAYLTLFVVGTAEMIWFIVLVTVNVIDEAFRRFVANRYGWLFTIIGMAYYLEVVYGSGTCP